MSETPGDATGFEAFVRSDLFRAILRTQHADLLSGSIATSTAVPTGAISQYAGDIAPESWLLCQGQEVLRDQYPALYATISNKYGTPSDSTKFKLPNLCGRVPVGAGAASGLTTRGLASTGGSEFLQAHNHTGGSSNSGNHTHRSGTTINGDWVGISTGYGEGGWAVADYPAYNNNVSHIYAADGGDHNHTIYTNTIKTADRSADLTTGSGGNMQPYLALNYIIRT
ncbi:MAG: hypothetical protein EB141_00925 [Verrucomicrobia bacterium]|nr:hypothetical protein [Verrucomicrobiota bacterium]NBV24125.1 hypothetical protein [Pseudomonadota bacterium]NDA65389.1 hypothetical protein [Verrucomicrobiota bacterium]NDB74206.1 hypothetical protein [Verrucomicrobiota bacterium]NDD36791.1 hypothetical protein [Verrucomicrobiota bacterium]